MSREEIQFETLFASRRSPACVTVMAGCEEANQRKFPELAPQAESGKALRVKPHKDPQRRLCPRERKLTRCGDPREQVSRQWRKRSGQARYYLWGGAPIVHAKV